MPDIVLVSAAASSTVDHETPGVAHALAARGLAAEIAAWDDPTVDWAAASLAVLRSTWDYPGRLAAFLAWVDAAGAATSLWNPPAAVRWNAHKGYLEALAGAGVAVVPTALLPVGAPARLEALLEERGWPRAVVKPAVSLGARGAARVRSGDVDGQRHLEALLAAGDVLVQAYAPEVERAGELSLVFLDGEPSHAVRKQPAAGEWRVHEQYGGSAQAVDPGADAITAAERALAVARAATGCELLYARVDLVPTAQGPRVMELELIEPVLFLASVPGATERFADRIASRCAAAREASPRLA